MKNADKPINPMPYQNQDGTIQHDVYFGLTKREYFAGLAIQGILSNAFYAKNTKKAFITKGMTDDIGDLVNEGYSKLAISIADELLKQLDESGESKP